EIAMLYKGKVTADAIKGQLNLSAGGRKLSTPFVGKRAKDEVVILGLWKIAMTLESGQKLRPSLLVQQDGDKLVGEYVGNAGQKVNSEVKLQKGEVHFEAPDSVDQERIVFRFEGKMIGDRIKGVARFGQGNKAGSLPFEASKSQAPTADVAGVWKLRVPTKD